DFVHLHVHTQYSILDGQASIKKLVDKAIGNGMRGMAITDHGNMFGIKEFFNIVEKINGGRKKEGLDPFKPIFGCEVYCARRSRLLHDKSNTLDQSGWHLILLAKNEVGYHNLIKIVSHAWVDGYYYRPRTDHEELEKYHEGIIASSACLAGEIPWYIRRGMMKEAEESVQWFKNLFGDDFYLELMRHEVTNPNIRANRETFPLQQQVNEKVIELARKYDVKLICTNDSHFVDEENAEAHDRLICLSTGKDLDDPNRMLYSKQEWFKTKEEMNAVFADIPEALANTAEILDKVEFYNINHAPIMPFFPIPESFGTEEEYRKRLTEKDLYDEFTQDENGNVVLSEEEGKKKIARLGGYEALYRIKFEADYLAHLAYKGAKRCYGDPVPDNVMQQIKFELHIMKTMGFPGYFLIVQDYIRAAREELGVWVGPGRGSAAGSVVAYCLDITKVDPIKYDLLFERFLNPDRISLPDIDVDFDDDGRGKVLQYVTDKYGADKVAHIITYNSMATKMAIKDVARVQKLPLTVSDELCKAIPDKLPDGMKMNLANVIKTVPKVKEAVTSTDPLLRDTMKYAMMLENNVRNTGVHACGTIICRDPITDWVPVSTADDKEMKEKVRCTQYDGHVIEETGLIKMDFLGLKNLSIMKEAVENIKESLGIDVDVNTLDINDPETYKLYCEGKTIGTFQFESAGMQKYLRELHPSCFEDLIAMNALYRPGPMDYIPDFIDRKLGRKPITYDIPCMEKYLKDTYGITVYQEQVMLLSRQLANFTRGESDTLRKAMGKKQKDKLDMLKPKFIEGGKSNGHDPKTLEKIWNDWEKFASYAFNKSHATCYSWVAYQTAYLKAHYPAQYMAAIMSRSMNDITEVRKLMDECKAMGINTLGPDVNESRLKFSVNKHGDIRFGLAAVKGIGISAVQAIIDERTKNGPYKNVFDFVERVNLSNCNRKCLESLALSGAFDLIQNNLPREAYFAENGREMFLDTLVRYGNRYQADMQQSANTLFGGMMAVDIVRPPLPANYEMWSDIERLNKERDLVGIYLSAHPLDEYAAILNYVCNTKVTELDNLEALSSKAEVTFGGIVNSVSTGYTKKGNPMGTVIIEDYSGQHKIALFGKDWGAHKDSFYEGVPVFVRAKSEPGQWDATRFNLNIRSVEMLSDVKDSLITKVTLSIPLDKLTEEMVQDLQELTKNNPGNAQLSFYIKQNEQINANFTARNILINLSRSIVDYVEQHKEIEMKVN
ncbi:MAG: DNA polymerase III subunit alpha, partial [Bacteroidales bacterium]|nr:DNA polymerase III subunit alpha [Bacteroidales bacterium]